MKRLRLNEPAVSKSPESKPRIVVVGGGFAGVQCARLLQKRSRGAFEVVLFARDNHMVFQPLLPDVAGSSLNPRAIAPPLRLLLPGVAFRNEEVQAIDATHGQLSFEGHDGNTASFPYDHLVLACGNVVNLSLLPGMADHAWPLKTIGDAIAIRAQVMRQLERADAASDADTRRRYLTIIVVGGGFSGVEMAGELNDLLRSLLPYYPNVGADDVNVTLLHSGDEILPEVSPSLRRFAQAKMPMHGVRLVMGKRAAEVTKHGVVLADGSRIEGSTVICTIGTAASPLIAGLDAEKERGRLCCEPDMRVRGFANLWAIGDCAAVLNAFDQQIAPPTAQFAERQGKQCAENLTRVLRGEPTRPFSFQPIGSACGIGGRRGVAEIYGIRFSGFIAFALWRSSFLMKIPSIAQKLKVGIDWAWELVFSRDLSHFRAVRSDPINRAHFAAGEVILRRSPVLRELYALQHGEAAVISIDSNGERELFRLAAGALIGEATLVDNLADSVEVRAVTACDVLIMGKQALSTLSHAFKPLEDVLERAINRPTLRIWRHHEHAMQGLANVPVSDLPMSANPPTVERSDAMGPAYLRMIEEHSGCLLITDQGRLCGIATRTDLLAALARGANRDSPVEVAMNPRVSAIASSASAAHAAELMADGALKYLPVVDAEQRPLALLSSDDFVRFALARPR